MLRQKSQAGVTLLEVILVLAIATTFILVAVRVYLQFSQQSYVQELQANVDTLFKSLSHFYQANCRDAYNEAGELKKGSGYLSPSKRTYPPKDPVFVSVTELTSWGFLPTWRPENPLIDPILDYRLQFNPSVGNRSVTTTYHWLDPQNPKGFSDPMPIQKAQAVVIWRLQVAVRMKDGTNMEAYKSLLGASCISSSAQDNIITPCNENPEPGEYLVWERLPTFGSAANASPLWPSVARLKQFNQQYTNDEFYAFNIDDPAYNEDVSYQNYLCGG